MKISNEKNEETQLMNRYRLSKAGINVKEGLERFNGKMELYESYLGRFLEDENYKLMCEAIERADVKAAFAAAHALKGVAGNLSLNKLCEDLNPLVELLRVNSMDGAKELLEKVSQDYDRIALELKNK